MVEFENYVGRLFDENQPFCVRINPDSTVTSQTEVCFHERQILKQYTNSYFQGLILSKAWIDIGKSERTAEVSCIAISRVKSRASCVIEAMTYERLTCLKSSGNLQKKTGAPEPRGQRGQLPLLPKRCGGSTGAASCPF